MGVVLTDKTAPIFQFVSERNRGRQYDFLHTAYNVSQVAADFRIDREFLCNLNFYAVQYLSVQPGKYRENYDVTVGKHIPPHWAEVEGKMQQFWDNLSRLWSRMGAIETAAYALWAVNNVHPFAEGNGRSSRALCYFILCYRLGMWLPGNTTIMELIRSSNRPEYCAILNRMDASVDPDGMADLREMTAFLDRLMLQQIGTA